MAKYLNRREFLRLGAISAAGLAVAGCATAPDPTQPAPAEPSTTDEPAAPEATAPEAEPVTLEFVSNLPEYENGYKQILDIFEAENPGISINLFSYSEDTEAAYLAKVAGGFLPAMERIPGNSGRNVNKDNYTEFVDLSETNFPWFDRWMYDVKNEWSNRFGLPGPRTLDVFMGIVASFIYHKDITDKMGVDPQSDIVTQEDLDTFLDELVLFVEKDPELDFGWDRGWINGFMYMRYMNLIPVAFADGQRDRQFDAWMGKAKFNAEDSPYRHTFEYSKKALERGWNSDGWWNREWEADQESTFTTKKSAMVMHGPWMWDKALANDPSLELLGFPFPSVDGKDTILHMEAPAIDVSWAIRAGNEETAYWDSTQDLFAFWFSPDIVKARSELEGRVPLYELDEELELDAPQWNGLLSKVGKGDWSNVRLDPGPWGEQAAAPYQIGGSPGPWDRGTGGYNDTFIDAIAGKISVQEALDTAQANWDASYEGLPLEG